MTEHSRDSQALPPAGWYPDPEHAGHLRWWDGAQWTLRQPVRPPATPGRPLDRGFARLSQALGVLLVLNIVVSAAQVALYLWGVARAIDAIEAGDLDTADTFDALNLTLAVGEVLMLVAAGVVWMVWQFRLASATEGLSRSPAMHAFSWIIPFANLWLPFQNVRDLWQRLTPLRSTSLLGWWWAGWVVAWVVARFFLGGDELESVDDLRQLVWTLLVLSVIGLGTALLALHVVRSLSRASWTAERVSREGSAAG